MNPDARGRGPREMGELHRWDRVDDLPIVGWFAGVVLGTRKGADTLIVELEDETFISIRYEHLKGVRRVDFCPECDLTLLTQSRRNRRHWTCSGCGHTEQRNRHGEIIKEMAEQS